MLAQSFDRFHIVTKFILPTMDDLKLAPIKYNKDCTYLHNLDDNDDKIKENITDLLTYCTKLRLYVAFYKMLINAHNKTTHHILKNEVDLILPKFPKDRKNERGILAPLFQTLLALLLKKFLASYTIGDIKLFTKQSMLCIQRQIYKK